MSEGQAARLQWQTAKVIELREETLRTRSIVLEVPSWRGHLAGQHVDVRLTAPDGYQAQRSYSLASAPEDPLLMLTVERLADGEVSPYLCDGLAPGDEIELRGPIGGYFVWQLPPSSRILLLAGGSGVVPFRAMLRHHAASGEHAEVRLIYSSRSLPEVIYAAELEQLAAAQALELNLVLTRAWPDGWTGPRGRIDRSALAQLAWPPDNAPLVYCCGPNGFVETAANELVALGHDPTLVRTERFGPSGT
ncbi:MAG TPA: ferredoxin reductase [Solirubrobacteraceae bacterium]